METGTEAKRDEIGLLEQKVSWKCFSEVIFIVMSGQNFKFHFQMDLFQKRLDLLHQEEKRLDLKLAQLNRLAADKGAIMNALHEYNNIKDATQIILGQLADLQGVTVKELHEKFDLPTNDGWLQIS